MASDFPLLANLKEKTLFIKSYSLIPILFQLNWQQYLSLGTARDFRIKGPVLQEVLNAREQADETRNEGIILSLKVLHIYQYRHI